MKNLSLILILAIAFFTQSCAQDEAGKDTPAAVKSAFSQKFPKAKKVKWEKENANEWEAEFKMNGKEYSANFASNGDWTETEYEIRKSDIPADIMAILDANFTDYEIEEAEVAETAAGKSYEFEIEQGEEEFEVVIDAQGKLTRKKEDEKNENDDEDDDDGDQE